MALAIDGQLLDYGGWVSTGHAESKVHRAYISNYIGDSVYFIHAALLGISIRLPVFACLGKSCPL